MHDSGGPISAPTDASGRFTSDAGGLSASQLATAMLVAQVPDTVRDANDAGATLAQADKSGLTLMLAASAWIRTAEDVAKSATAATVSPLTALVVAEMVFNRASYAQAQPRSYSASALAQRTR